MKKNLFLDDVRNPDDAGNYMGDNRYRTELWEIVRDYKEFCGWVNMHGIPDLVSFDHDLADEHYGGQVDYRGWKEKTGYHCAKWLVDYCFDNKLKFPEYLIHSMNPVGKQNILLYLENYKKHEAKDFGNRTSTTGTTTSRSL